MRYFVTVGGREHTVEITDTARGAVAAAVLQEDGHAAREVDVTTAGGTSSVRVGTRMVDVVVSGTAEKLDVWASGARSTVSLESARTRAAAASRGPRKGTGPGTLFSPMPGKVTKVLVREGDTVELGAPLVIVEAMKMENELTAERPGTVQKVLVQAGDAVEGGATLVVVG